jgi:NitT/TauT family transport system substrate-binding protein
MKTDRARLGTVSAILLLVCAVALCLPANLMAANVKLNFTLDWTIYGTHAPFYLALEKGFYAEEGIDVSISEGQGSATVTQIIAGGKTPIGYIDYATMAQGVVQGVPVKAVFGVTQTSPMAIISNAGNPIKTPKEMEGKVIAMAPAESTAQIFPALVAAAGVDAKKISIVNPAVGAKIALFLQNRADAITGYSQLQTIQLEDQGAKVYHFKYADFGVNTLSNGVAVNNDFLAKNGDLVKRFLRATAKAWALAQKDPGAAVEAIFKARPEFRDKRNMLLRQLELTFPLLSTSNTKGKPLGWMAKKDWEDTQEILSKYANLKKTIPVEQYFTNDYIP